MTSYTTPSLILRHALAATIATLFSACETPRYVACYGFDRHDSVAVRIVEVASSSGTYPLETPMSYLAPPTPSSCLGFDGVTAGGILVIEDIELANKASRGVQCSTPLGDILLDEHTQIRTIRDQKATDYPYTATIGGDVFGGVGTVAPGTTVETCSGTWVLATYPRGLFLAHWGDDGFLHPDPSSPDWLDEYTFDQLSPGSEPPVVIVRTFVVDEGTACPALGVESGPFTCGDVFSGYYEPAP
jgi:hypothetical protein